VLLDQKKTRRMVVIVSIISAVGFVGVLPVVLGLVVFGDSGGGANNQIEQLVRDAERKVQQSPNQVVPLVELAAQYRAADRPQDELATLQKAIAIGPKTGEELQSLVSGLAQQPALQIQVLTAYAKKNPKDADAWFLYGATAERTGQVVAARLAYQNAAKYAPKGSTLAENAQTAFERMKNTPLPQTPAQGGTTTTPATPATPATP
jgi:cytochrome c-type biogenesis protein CcmH/NrfG